MSYQKFFCPNCGHPIQHFHVEVGDTGYHMAARCPKCRTNVQGVAEMNMSLSGETGVS